MCIACHPPRTLSRLEKIPYGTWVCDPLLLGALSVTFTSCEKAPDVPGKDWVYAPAPYDLNVPDIPADNPMTVQGVL